MTTATTHRPQRASARRAIAPPPPLGRELLAGAAAGQLAGLLVLLVVTPLFAVAQEGLLFPQVLGELWFGPIAVTGHVHLPALFLGIATHLLGPSLYWGVVFGALAHASGARFGGQLSALAIAVGVSAQLVDVHLILPLLQAGLDQPDFWSAHVPGVWSWMYHLLFAAGLIYGYPLALRVLGRPAR